MRELIEFDPFFCKTKYLQRAKLTYNVRFYLETWMEQTVMK